MSPKLLPENFHKKHVDSNPEEFVEKSIRKKISQEISDLEQKQRKSQNEIDKIIFSLPNLAHDDVPVGKDEKSNKFIKKTTKSKFCSFVPKRIS